MEEIIPKYQHSKLGTVMFNLCANWTKFLVKHKWLYYLLACTWGFILTFIGILITIILAIIKIFSKTISFEKYNWIYFIKVGPNYWGGFEMGLMFVRDKKSTDYYINPHEFGHTFQNCLFGPLMIFLVTIPSAIRWWSRKLISKKDLPAYDVIWFEDSATQCGKYVEKYLEK